jgi:hypothetical protein
VWWLIGCGSAAPVVEVPPEVATTEVLAALDQALTRIRDHDPDAASAVRQAYDRFQRDLEPGLRARLGPSDVLALEYEFARVAAAADDPSAAERAVSSLKAELASTAR